MAPRVALLSDGGRIDEETRASLAAALPAVAENLGTTSLGSTELHEADVIVLAVLDAQRALQKLTALRRSHARGRLFALLARSVPFEDIKLVSHRVDDFAVLPVSAQEVAARLERLVASAALPSGSTTLAGSRSARQDLCLRALVGEAPGFLKLVRKIPRIAESDASVLITGETGTGKELFARAIHQLSPRHTKPFVAVDCGAFPEQLLENELFGHVRGAFTDARSEHKGLARMAEGGVLFLDEIDSLSLSAQGKLLRFLQERTFKPLGADRYQSANVRVIAATNGDLPSLVKQRKFRADLFFRLNIVPLRLLPLRERASDIPLLAARFLEVCNQEARGEPKRLTERAMDSLMRYRWPGNVRELYNLVQRAVVLVEGNEIDAKDLFYEQPATEPVASVAPRSFREAKAQAVAEFERQFVASLLQRYEGNISRASREAGKDRRAFGRLVKKYSLGRDGSIDTGPPNSEREA
jgi:two-component system response regulator GlrR